MDPNESLQACRRLTTYILNEGDHKRALQENTNDSTYAEALAANFQALDEWIQKGGFLPDAWRVK